MAKRTWSAHARPVGRPHPVPAALCMATPVATRCNSAIRAAYARFLAAGKPKKVALVACMRKLLVVLNAVARIGQPWDERAAEPVSRRLHGQASDRPP